MQGNQGLNRGNSDLEDLRDGKLEVRAVSEVKSSSGGVGEKEREGERLGQQSGNPSRSPAGRQASLLLRNDQSKWVTLATLMQNQHLERDSEETSQETLPSFHTQCVTPSWNVVVHLPLFAFLHPASSPLLTRNVHKLQMGLNSPIITD